MSCGPAAWGSSSCGPRSLAKFLKKTKSKSYMWAIFAGDISLSFPTTARPVAAIRRLPFSVSSRSVMPVWR